MVICEIYNVDICSSFWMALELEARLLELVHSEIRDSTEISGKVLSYLLSRLTY